MVFVQDAKASVEDGGACANGGLTLQKVAWAVAGTSKEICARFGCVCARFMTFVGDRVGENTHRPRYLCKIQRLLCKIHRFLCKIHRLLCKIEGRLPMRGAGAVGDRVGEDKRPPTYLCKIQKFLCKIEWFFCKIQMLLCKIAGLVPMAASRCQ